ncbi:MAG: Nramp family divalent metal transporter [Pseudomonadota bacterium]
MRLPIGPGALVAAAFVGPGTVTACTLAGAQFGYALLWALVFATIATVILQEMAGRLGAGAQQGLGEALMAGVGSRPLKYAVAGLVFAALMIGNAAYEGGNIAGATLGGQAIVGPSVIPRWVWPTGIGGLVAIALWFGRYQTIEALLIVLVLIMSLAFVASAVVTRPDWAAMLSGLRPTVPSGGTLTAIALIGTTIVPYNLFLHAAASKARWAEDGGVVAARQDTILSVGLGGLVSILILSAAAASLFGTSLEIVSAADMATALEPTIGPAARYVIGLGLLAAGLTSAITAPMATGFAMAELFPTSDNAKRQLIFRVISLTIVVIGVGVTLSGLRPVSLILIAQAANGLLLPVIAIFLLVVMNRRSLIGVHVNGLASNAMGALVVLVAIGLGARGIVRALGLGS